MKTVRRHELQTNTLADWTGKAIEDARPYGKIIGGTILAVVVLVIAFLVMTNRSQEGQAKAWSAYFSAANSQEPDELESVVGSQAGTSPGRWAALLLADRQLSEGLSQLLVDQAASTEALRNAVENYKLAAEEPHDLVRQRAYLGLAKAHESLRELDPARAEYRRLIEEWPDGVFSEMAQERLADLDSDSTKRFYDWLADQKAIPPAGAGQPGDRPPFDFDFDHPPVDNSGGTTTGDRPNFSSLIDGADTAPAEPADDSDGGDFVLPPLDGIEDEEPPADDGDSDEDAPSEDASNDDAAGDAEETEPTADADEATDVEPDAESAADSEPFDSEPSDTGSE